MLCPKSNNTVSMVSMSTCCVNDPVCHVERLRVVSVVVVWAQSNMAVSVGVAAVLVTQFAMCPEATNSVNGPVCHVSGGYK